MSSLSWRTRLALSVVSAVTGTAHCKDGTVNRRLLRLLEFRTPPNPNPVKSVSSADTLVDPARDLWFRLFSPSSSSAAGSSSLPVVFFFHGGGFTYLSPSSFVYDAVCRRFARELSAFIVSVNYRLAPEHRCPAQYDDGFDVLRFVDENRGKILPPNADLSKCFLVRDSAGGNLAHHVVVRACQVGGFRELKPVGLVSIQPFFGGEEQTESEKWFTELGGLMLSLRRTNWCWRAFLPEGSNRDDEAANVSGPNAVDISGLDFPDTVVFIGGSDPLQDWQRSYCEWLKKSGVGTTLVEYPNMIHAFYVFPELPESAHLIMQVKDFIANRLSVNEPNKI